MFVVHMHMFQVQKYFALETDQASLLAILNRLYIFKFVGKHQSAILSFLWGKHAEVSLDNYLQIFLH